MRYRIVITRRRRRRYRYGLHVFHVKYKTWFTSKNLTTQPVIIRFITAVALRLTRTRTLITVWP